MPQPDGSQKAIGLHIFMDAQRGVVPARFMPWDREPGSTMTNADVESTVAGVDGQTMMVKYPDGEKKIIVPPNTPVPRLPHSYPSVVFQFPHHVTSKGASLSAWSVPSNGAELR